MEVEGGKCSLTVEAMAWRTWSCRSLNLRRLRTLGQLLRMWIKFCPTCLQRGQILFSFFFRSRRFALWGRVSLHSERTSSFVEGGPIASWKVVWLPQVLRLWPTDLVEGGLLVHPICHYCLPLRFLPWQP